jgi:Leucine-rich repeat (LRR) protein
VAKLINLNVLGIKNNKIKDISSIKLLKNLVTIDVRENCITDFSPIDYLKENGSLTSVQGDSVSDQDYDRCK